MDEIQKERIRRRIRQIRMDSGLSQKDFAERVGISQNSMNRLENGHRLPDLDFLHSLRVIFHIDLNQLIDMKQDSVSTNTVPVFDNVQLSLPQHDRRTHEFMALPESDEVAFYYQIKDDAMAPTICLGDWVGVSSESPDLGDMAFICDQHGIAQARRLGRAPSGAMVLIADNSSFTINGEVDGEIIGRVNCVIRRKKI